MSHRTLPSSEQRTRQFGIPTDAAGMAKYYVLSADDLALVGAKRRIGNRLGFAVQLCLLRHPGQNLGFGERPPEAMIAFVARQVGALPTAFADYALRDQTRREHAVELQPGRARHRAGSLYARSLPDGFDHRAGRVFWSRADFWRHADARQILPKRMALRAHQ
jgi:Domain of unknown function (DUF4158)